METTERKQPLSENAAAVQSVYDAFGRGDVETVFGLVHPGVEIYQSSRLPWAAATRDTRGSGSSSRS